MALPFVLKFNNKAARALEQLPKEISSRIWNKLQEAKANPFRYFTRLKGRSDYKIRIGDYRAAADIRRNERAIEVTKIGHRRNFYKQA